MTESFSTKLQTKRKRLIESYVQGDRAGFLEMHTKLVDEYFQESYDQSKTNQEKDPYAIIALGGYGRQEQCIHSDIDVLILYNKRVGDQAEALIQEMIYPLWDSKFDVGQSVRTLSDCVRLATEDLEVLTSLLDARFICGDQDIYETLIRRLNRKLGRMRSHSTILQIIESIFERHRLFGDSAFLLEPNIKDGRGGLRDYHSMLWLARVDTGLGEPDDLLHNGYLSQYEYTTFSEALSFIWDVRNQLHHLMGRRGDRLYFEHQTSLAQRILPDRKNGASSVELFLGRLHSHFETIKHCQLMFLSELGYQEKSGFRRRIFRKKTDVEGLKISRNLLGFAAPQKISNTPELLIRIFEERTRLGIPLSADAIRLVREFSGLIDPSFRGNAANVKTFERILSSPDLTFEALNGMLSTGFLGGFIPEFVKTIERVQYNEYHLYPTAKHLLKTVEALKNFANQAAADKDNLYNNLYKELSRKKTLLLWAGLLHDIGKGEKGGDHAKRGATMARNILARLGYSEKRIQTASFLVEEHLLLMNTATMRDIYDEQTVLDCAVRIQDVARLKMLYLLTVADAVSTGPKAWNDWMEALLRDLFFKVLKVLEKDELAASDVFKNNQKKKEQLLATFIDAKKRSEAESLLRKLSPRYLLNCNKNEILGHIALYRQLGTEEFIWEIKKDEETETRTITVCAKDRTGLFSIFAGVVTLNALNILNARVFIWPNNIALLIMKVTPPLDTLREDRTWNRTHKDLKNILADELDLPNALKKRSRSIKSKQPFTSRRPPRVEFDNDVSNFFTVIEVFAYDYPGLLYSVTDVFQRCGLNILVAKIATKIDQVVDVFYVREASGEKVTSPEKIEQLKKEIGTVVERQPLP